MRKGAKLAVQYRLEL